mmetsp:Transcript_3094/g.4558  ORF Transcript_3094/g.4558 Transcript_3094/m.4558 type:complete len:362 (+) Transcript_3094:48-1133(+)
MRITSRNLLSFIVVLLSVWCMTWKEVGACFCAKQSMAKVAGNAQLIIHGSVVKKIHLEHEIIYKVKPELRCKVENKGADEFEYFYFKTYHDSCGVQYNVGETHTFFSYSGFMPNTGSITMCNQMEGSGDVWKLLPYCSFDCPSPLEPKEIMAKLDELNEEPETLEKLTRYGAEEAPREAFMSRSIKGEDSKIAIFAPPILELPTKGFPLRTRVSDNVMNDLEKTIRHIDIHTIRPKKDPMMQKLCLMQELAKVAKPAIRKPIEEEEIPYPEFPPPEFPPPELVDPIEFYPRPLPIEHHQEIAIDIPENRPEPDVVNPAVSFMVDESKKEAKPETIEINGKIHQPFTLQDLRAKIASRIRRH